MRSTNHRPQYQGKPTLLEYSSTKGAIVAFTRSLAKALIEQGIRVNAVAPGPVLTPYVFFSIFIYNFFPFLYTTWTVGLGRQVVGD